MNNKNTTAIAKKSSLSKMNPKQSLIYSYLLSMMAEGKLKIGDRLPTEVTLAKKFNMPRMNAHFAVKQLVVKGLVSRNKKQGTIVIDVPSKSKAAQIKNVNSKQIYILASPFSQWIVHWNNDSIKNLEHILEGQGYKTVFRELPQSREKLSLLFDELIESGCFSIIVMPEHKEYDNIQKNPDILVRYHGEIYFFNCGELDSSEMLYHELAPNNFEEGKIAAEYILNKDCEKIVFLSTCSNFPWSINRLKGAQFGIRVHRDSKELMVLQEEEGHDDDILFQKACELIKGSKDKIGFIMGNDTIAVQFIKYARKNYDIKAPDDFLSISFDNFSGARMYNLTTISPSTEKVAPTLAKMIFDRSWQMKNGIQLSIKLRPYLIKRKSC